MNIGKELKSIAEEKSGHLDYKDILEMYPLLYKRTIFFYDNRCETYCYYTIQNKF